MSGSDRVVKGAGKAKALAKDCPNNWNWSWMDRKLDDVTYDSWCRKLEESGKAYCVLCRCEFRYSNTDRSKRTHRSREIQENFSEIICPFLFLFFLKKKKKVMQVTSKTACQTKSKHTRG